MPTIPTICRKKIKQPQKCGFTFGSTEIFKKSILSMLIYNVTVNIEEETEQEWKSWMKDVHIPEVLATGKFTGYKFLRLLNEVPDATGSTYAVQYYVDNIGLLDSYLQNEAHALRKSHIDKFGQKAVAFRTVLEEVI